MTPSALRPVTRLQWDAVFALPPAHPWPSPIMPLPNALQRLLTAFLRPRPPLDRIAVLEARIAALQARNRALQATIRKLLRP